MNTRRLLNVIVVSPGDVAEERERVRGVVDELNDGIAEELGLRLAVWMWETDGYPALHIYGGQGHLDDLMRIETSDVVIGIFWKRFGTPVGDAQSGTEHELQKAIISWTETKRPEIMLYFNFARYFPDNEPDLDQARRVTHFREQLSSQALWWKYDGTDDFEKLLRLHLTAWLRKKSHQQPGASHSESAPVLQAPVFHDAVARTRHIQGLASTLRAKPVVTVEGLSGVGKTYMVSAFCTEAVTAGLYAYVWWHQAEQNDTVDNLLTQAGQLAELAGTSAPARCRALIRRLESTNGLLVIDDFERTDLRSYDPLIAAGRSVAAPARLLLLSKTFTDPALTLGDTSVPLEGFDETELQTFLAKRGVALTAASLKALCMKTGGLPIAASIFATLAIRFGYSADELLAGSMQWKDRLRRWFEKIRDSIQSDSMLLLRSVSVSETPFDRGAVRQIGRVLNLAHIDAAFDQLQSAYLVQTYALQKWRVHPLVAAFAVESMSLSQLQKAHRAFATYYSSGYSERSGRILEDQEFSYKTLAVRHFQRAGMLKRSERLIGQLVKSAKARGAYELLIQLVAPQLAESDRDRWMDYHYIHCCLIVGRVTDAALVLQRTEPTPEAPELALSLSRIRAEVLRASGSPAAALQQIQSALSTIGEGRLQSTALSQAEGLRALLLVENGMLAEAEEACSRLLSTASEKNEKIGIAVALTLIGYIAVANRKSADAELRFSEAVALFRDCGDQRGLSWAAIELALVCADLKQETARLMLHEALAIRAEISDCSSEYLERLGRVHLHPTFEPLHLQITAEISRVQKTLRLPLL